MPCLSRCLLVLVVLMLVPVSSGWAQERTPTPKELWDAYPLQPGEASPTPTVGSDVPSPQATVVTADERKPGTSWLVPVLLAVPLVAAAAMLLTERRRRRAAAEPEEPATAPRRSFGWDHFPPPARPAPPAPPPPPVRGGRR